MHDQLSAYSRDDPADRGNPRAPFEAPFRVEFHRAPRLAALACSSRCPEKGLHIWEMTVLPLDGAHGRDIGQIVAAFRESVAECARRILRRGTPGTEILITDAQCEI